MSDGPTFSKTRALLEAGVAQGVAPGMVAGIWERRVPEKFSILTAGQRRVVPPPAQGMESGTVFDLASLTKIFGTTALAGVLVDRGWIRWDTPLAALLSGYPYPEIQLRHLLAHTAGFAAWAPFWEQLRARFAPCPLYAVSVADRQRFARELICAAKPERGVGERALYSDISFLLLGFALEEVTRMPLDLAVRELVWGPLGVSAFYRRVTADPGRAALSRVAATEVCPWRGGTLQGQVHDDNCWAMGGYAGHAGAFGTATDLLRFSRALFDGFFSPDTLRAMWTRVDQPPGCERTMGWDTPSGESPSVGRLFSSKSVGHLGFTGTSLWIDPAAEIAVTLLTNRVHPSRENQAIREFRPRFHDAVREDLGR